MTQESLRMGRKTWLQYNGRIYCLEESVRGVSNKETTSDLIAPFSCKILKLMVEPGADVKTGDPVLSVEAMKMEHTFTSPKNGKIKTFLVAESAIVEDGTKFVEWEEQCGKSNGS